MVRFPSFGESAAYAQYVAVPASDLAHKPAGLDHVHAAAAPMAGLTAWQFLIERGHAEPNPLQATLHNPVPIGAGTTVLVNGAAGGVGHMALQLAKWKGARVIAVASGAHETFLRASAPTSSSTTPRHAPRRPSTTSTSSSTPSAGKRNHPSNINLVLIGDMLTVSPVKYFWKDPWSANRIPVVWRIF
ncbi:hypothetical protein L7F22_015995 [Adiantum nelumboides]|nr:hypothetical protein [Adiantum nelumboides]